MVVQAPLPPHEQGVEAGVIDDARKRKRRHRMNGVAALVGAAIGAGAVLGFWGGSGGPGTSRSRAEHGGELPKLASHTVIGAPSAALLRDAIRECDGPRFRLNPAGTFTGPLALAAGTSRFVGLIAITRHNMSVCAVRVPHLTPYGPGLQGRVNLRSPRLKAPGADKLRFDGFVSTGGLAGSEMWAYGRAGRGVLAVIFVLKDRHAVSAEVKGGWYMAWWPGTAATAMPTYVRIRTKSGTVQCRAHAPSCAFLRSP